MTGGEHSLGIVTEGGYAVMISFPTALDAFVARLAIRRTPEGDQWMERYLRAIEEVRDENIVINLEQESNDLQ